MKTVTYVAGKQQQQQMSPSTLTQPLKLTTTQYALTPNGERVAIKGLDAASLQPGSTVQVQVKHHPGGGIQLQGLNIDPSKLTVLQELPDVSKVIIQEPRHQTDSITNILEEMKTEEANNAGKLKLLLPTCM